MRTGRLRHVYTYKTRLGTFHVPAGTRVRYCDEPNPKREYWVDEFDFLPRHSMERHDATYYGIRVPEHLVDEPDDTYVVTGVTVTGKRFRIETPNMMHAYGINLWRGSRWIMRKGRKIKLQTVCN